MKITRSGACKNSPKNALVENLVIDLITGASLEERLQENASLPAVPGGVSEVAISHAISHGKIGAVNGFVTVDGSVKPFAAFVEFTSTKAASVTSLNLYLTA